MYKIDHFEILIFDHFQFIIYKQKLKDCGMEMTLRALTGVR